MTQALSPQEKKNYLLAKYNKRDYSVEELKPKYAVYFNPAIDKVKEWNLICVCMTREECQKEILWRQAYHTTNDMEIVIDKDRRFSTWKDETKNVNPQTMQVYEPDESHMLKNYDGGNMIQVIANSVPKTPQENGFRGAMYYTQPSMEVDYKGFYKIEEIYEI